MTTVIPGAPAFRYARSVRPQPAPSITQPLTFYALPRPATGAASAHVQVSPGPSERERRPGFSRDSSRARPVSHRASTMAAKAVLGWEAKHTDLREIIETAWKWYREHPRGYVSP